MDIGLHSKRELDLRENTEFANALAGLGLSSAEQQKSSNVILVQIFCRPKRLLFHCANTGIQGLCSMVGTPIRHDGAIRPESDLGWINPNIHSYV